MFLPAQPSHRGVADCFLPTNDGEGADIGRHMTVQPVSVQMETEFEMAAMTAPTKHHGSAQGARETGDTAGKAHGRPLHGANDALNTFLLRSPARSRQQGLDPAQTGKSTHRTREDQQAERFDRVSIISPMMTRTAFHGISDGNGSGGLQGDRTTLIKYVRIMELMEAPVADEILALDRNGTRCFGFNASASAIWRYLETPLTLSEIVERVTEDFDIDVGEAENDVRALLEELTKKGLIRGVDGADHVQA